jgi:hypothetical protein
MTYSPECVEGVFCELRPNGQRVEKVGIEPIATYMMDNS